MTASARQRKDLPPLLHCPFCGSNHLQLVSNSDSGNKFVACLRCEGTGPSARTERSAVTRWNNRKYLHYA